MSYDDKQPPTMEAIGQIYTISLLPFVAVTVGAYMEGWKFTKAATAGLWVGPGFISVFVIACYLGKGVRLVWEDIFSLLPGAIQEVLRWAAILLIVALLALAFVVTVTGYDSGYLEG